MCVLLKLCDYTEFSRVQLFVAATHHKGLPLPRQGLSHWIVKATAVAYQNNVSPAP